MKKYSIFLLAALWIAPLTGLAQYPNHCKAAEDGYPITWDNTTGQFKCTAVTAGAATSLKFGSTTINLDSTAPTSGEYLKYDGTKITGGTPSGSGGSIQSWASPYYENGGTNVPSANAIRINLFSLQASLSTSKITYRVKTTDGSHNYSVGLYDASGNLVAHTTPGSLPANDTVVQASWVEGTVALTPGNYYFAFTGEATTGQIYSEGSGTPQRVDLLSTQIPVETSSSGALTSTITIPALTGSSSSNHMLFVLS